MNWYIIFTFCIIIMCVIIWKYSYFQEKYNAWKLKRMSKWVLLHKDELPFLTPNVINAGNWHEVTEETVAELSGIYLFLCRGDNHLLYEVYEVPKGFYLMSNFISNYEHSDGWTVIKPLYYYYVKPLKN